MINYKDLQGTICKILRTNFLKYCINVLFYSIKPYISLMNFLSPLVGGTCPMNFTVAIYPSQTRRSPTSTGVPFSLWTSAIPSTTNMI